jgi:EAL domain-containing protein (putative c-di-GMP-specific phosphodiesterase class I)
MLGYQYATATRDYDHFVANLEDAADINEMRSTSRFSLDDFGVAVTYSYLKRLPVDFIKIDGAFVRDITRSDVDFALVRSITEMGHYLKKKVIAEYVSAEDILETVKSIGVDYAQGHVHGLPGLLDHLVIEDPRLLQPVSE